MSEHVTEELGGYILGALEPDEAERVRRHLLACATCRHEHECLAALPALLELAGPARSVALPTPPAALEDAVVGALALRGAVSSDRKRNRRTWRVPRLTASRAGLAGALAGALAVLAVVGPARFGGERALTVTLRPTASDGGATATLHPVAWGTRVDLDVHGMAPTRAGQVYELWFVRPGGRLSAGTFAVGASGRANVALASAARPGEYERLGVTREPDGLDPARNGPNVLTGRLSDR